MNENLTPAMLDSLRQTKPWVRFLSILGFLSVALMVVIAFVMLVAGTVMGGDDNAMGLSGAVAIGMAAIYLVLGVLYIFPALYLFRYASAIGVALDAPAKSAPVEDALRQQKSFWKFTGILMLIMILVYIPVILAAVAIPNFLTAMQRSKQKRTMADMRTIATAIEAYATDQGTVPRAASLDELARALEPKYIRTLPRVDGWDAPLVYETADCEGDRCATYFLGSGGKDGKLARAKPSEYAGEGEVRTTNFNDDIVFTNGSFLRSP